MTKREKAARQTAITEIVSGKKVGTQQELVAELKEKGFDVTQATVSRDITELRLQRVREAGIIGYYALPGEERQGASGDRLKSVLREFGRSVTYSTNLVILKTSPGGAQPVARALDGSGLEEVLGTVAGDDTILVVTANARSGKAFSEKLKELMA